MPNCLIEDGSNLACYWRACFGRQHGVAGRTPRIVSPHPIEPASPRAWVWYYAGLDSNIDFLASLWCYFWGFAPW